MMVMLYERERVRSGGWHRADKDHVFYQTHSGVHALDIQTGKIIWELPIGNYMLSPKLRISGDDLVFFASDNCVHVVDKRTGQTKLVAPFPKV